MVKKIMCPVCSGTEIVDLYSVKVPVLQNKVFTEVNEAKNSPSGHIGLSSCSVCSFVFNSTFDADVLVYDTSYDNSVPSDIFMQYYENIADYLYEKYDLKNGILYDVGCGKGTFLKIMCNKYPDIRAIGIDPSYEGDLVFSENLYFIQDFFDSKYVTERPSLVISRHVFEHIEKPTIFLKIISEAISDHKDVPFFIEVPDFKWIIENETFWDICYEHCNYFNTQSLERLIHLSEAFLSKITPSFKNQYLWCEGVLNYSNGYIVDKLNILVENRQYLKFTDKIQYLIENSKVVLNHYKNIDYKIVVWGMATKGVEYCNLIDDKKNLIDFCIDINGNKQNKFIPFTGHQIQSPDYLLTQQDSILIVIMNTNYINEIQSFVNKNSLKALYINGHGELI